MTEIQEFIKNRPHLIWYSKDYEHLADESIVEHVLNYGDWEDFKEMIRIMGMERAAEIFRREAFKKRTNYHKEVARYFQKYFDSHNTLTYA
jgi:hypothetical protein